MSYFRSANSENSAMNLYSGWVCIQEDRAGIRRPFHASNDFKPTYVCLRLNCLSETSTDFSYRDFSLTLKFDKLMQI